MNSILGIDPGKKGALAVLTDKGHYWTARTPLKKDGTYDLEEMLDMVQNLKVSSAVIEYCQPYPFEGVRSSHTAGFGYGLWQMTLTACELPFLIAHPAVWRKEIVTFRNKGKDSKEKKAINERMFRKLFPQTPRDHGLNDGEVDAVLIAEFGRRKKKYGD